MGREYLKPERDEAKLKNNLKTIRAAARMIAPTRARCSSRWDGRAVRVAGDPAHPFTRGTLCTKSPITNSARTARPHQTHLLRTARKAKDALQR